MERRHFYVRELVEDGVLTVPYVATTSNMADFFTKPLAAAQFYTLRNLIMNFERPVPSEPACAHARMTRRDRRHQRVGGCRDAVPTAQLQDLLCPAALLESAVIRDPTCGIRAGVGIRADLTASAVESSAATTSERTIDVSHVRHDYSGVVRSSGSVAAAVQRTDVRPAAGHPKP